LETAGVQVVEPAEREGRCAVIVGDERTSLVE
jgi:hypothetical protein